IRSPIATMVAAGLGDTLLEVELVFLVEGWLERRILVSMTGATYGGIFRGIALPGTDQLGSIQTSATGLVDLAILFARPMAGFAANAGPIRRLARAREATRHAIAGGVAAQTFLIARIVAGRIEIRF